MSDIILGTATRQNLLALQHINTDLGTTQNHLATGLAVSSALDDAVKFFQSQSLTDRANDLAQRKDAIDQGISSLTAATNATQSAVLVGTVSAAALYCVRIADVGAKLTTPLPYTISVAHP